MCEGEKSRKLMKLQRSPGRPGTRRGALAGAGPGAEAGAVPGMHTGTPGSEGAGPRWGSFGTLIRKRHGKRFVL